MLTGSRRATAVVMGILSLYNSLAPGVAAAAERSATARQAALAITEVVEIFAADGSIEERFAGADLLSRVTSSAASLRSANKAKYAEMRATLNEWAKKSKRGEAGIATMLKIVNALDAPTDAEFRARLHQLPISIARTPARDALGRAGTRTDYSRKGVLRVRTFRLAQDDMSRRAVAVGGATVDDAPEPNDDPGSSDLMADPSSGAPLPVECTYTDDESIVWTGECATQGEIDDAMIVSIALEDEMAALGVEVDDMTADYNQWCADHVIECAEREDQPAPARGPSVVEGCTANALAFTASGLNFVYRGWKLAMVLNAINPPAGAVLDAVMVATVASIVVVGAAMALGDCYDDRMR